MQIDQIWRLRSEEWVEEGLRKNRGRVLRRAKEVEKAEEVGIYVLSLQLEDQRLKLKIPIYPGYSV